MLLAKIEALKTIEDTLEPLTNFCDYLLHPSHIFFSFWNWTVECSFYVCLLVAMFSIICKAFKIRKFSKLAPFSVGAYILIQSIGKVVFR